MSVSHFDEVSGIIPCKTQWGSWWQTVHDIHIEIKLPKNTRSKDVKVNISNNFIECIVHQDTIIKGKLNKMVHGDNSLWTIEDGCLLNIVMTKAYYDKKEEIWEALLQDGSYQPDPLTINEMWKKIDLEKFQLENPGMDFSKAKLSKVYDKTPGVSYEQ